MSYISITHAAWFLNYVLWSLKPGSWNFLPLSLLPGTCCLVPCMSPPVPGISCHCLFFLEHAAWFLVCLLQFLEFPAIVSSSWNMLPGSLYLSSGPWRIGACSVRDVPWTLPLAKGGRRYELIDLQIQFDYRLYRTLQYNLSISSPNCVSIASVCFKFRFLNRAVGLLHLDFFIDRLYSGPLTICWYYLLVVYPILSASSNFDACIGR